MAGIVQMDKDQTKTVCKILYNAQILVNLIYDKMKASAIEKPKESQ